MILGSFMFESCIQLNLQYIRDCYISIERRVTISK